jgi:ABC-type spermidine/putrescine transport system permease subunit II
MKTKITNLILLLYILIISGPSIISVCVAFSPDSFLTIPTNHWTLNWFIEFLNQNRWTNSLLRTILFGLTSTFFALAIGIPLAYAMTRLDVPFKKLIHGALLLPLVIPPIILGMGAMPMFYMMRMNGTPLQIILMHTLLVLPIIYLILKIKFESMDIQIEEAARGLGATLFQSILLITIPLIKPSIAISGVAAFVISINESMVAIFLAGPANETISTISWSQLKNAPTPLIAVASLIHLAIITLGAISIYLIMLIKNTKDKNNKTQRNE